MHTFKLDIFLFFSVDPKSVTSQFSAFAQGQLQYLRQRRRVLLQISSNVSFVQTSHLPAINLPVYPLKAAATPLQGLCTHS